MSGNMHRWISNDWIPAKDNASQYSAAYSDVSAVDDNIRSPDIAQRLRSLFKEELYTDVKFIISCGLKPKPTLLAHKAILAIGSNKFREILYDSNSPTGQDEIQINNIPFDAFRNVVEFLYTDDVIFENDQSVLETLSAALKFEVQPLVDKCESYIESVELTEDNVCTKFQLASSSKLASLKTRCIEFIQENTGSVLRSADFMAANSSTVRSICKLEKLNLRSEIELLGGVIRWVEARQDVNTSKRVLVEPFLKHLRLLNVTGEEFNQFVQRHPNIFTAPETANVLISLANPANPAPNLPPWCKRGSNRCTYHLLAAPTAREREGGGNFNPLKKLFIMLRPTYSKESPSNMMCILQMKCSRGSHKIDGLKFSFDDPVHEMSVIGHLIIKVDVDPSKYHFEEHIKIENSKDVEVRFSKRLLAKRGDTIYITAEAKEVKNYRFLQFDESNSFSPDSSFVCSLGSVPKENRFFFISEVVYMNAPPPVRNIPLNPRNQRNHTRSPGYAGYAGRGRYG